MSNDISQFEQGSVALSARFIKFLETKLACQALDLLKHATVTLQAIKLESYILIRPCRETRRERVMPLVPQPFSEISISRQSVFMRSTRPMADLLSVFCPKLNIPQYRESLSQKKRTKLDERATTLNRRAIRNHLYQASEFCWEVSAWNDVFGLLYNDQRFLMLVISSHGLFLLS